MNNSAQGRLRIIAGLWRGSKLDFPDRQDLRPTTDRVRETVFNWLQADIAGSRCLDLFAGSGALGFEAASRGASSVLLLDNDQATVAMLEGNCRRLDAKQVQVVCDDAIKFLGTDKPPTEQNYDIVFVDPPYQSGLLGSCCRLLEQGHWLANHAKIYLECDARDTLTDLPGNWHCQKSKKAGQVGYQLYTRDNNQGE